MDYLYLGGTIIIPSKGDAEAHYRNEWRKKFINDVDKANIDHCSLLDFEYPKWLVDEITESKYEVDITGVSSECDYRNAGEFDSIRGVIRWV